MMQAIGTLERAISRLEQAAAALPQHGPQQDQGLGVDAAGAREALKSLDELIAELRGEPRG